MADGIKGLDDLRNSNAAQIDPVRFRFIEALASRAQAYHGETRRLLEARLASAVQACATRCAQASPEQAVVKSTRGERPLADLLARLAQAMQPAEPADATTFLDTQHAPPAELKSLRQFRSAWSKLGIEQQLSEALTQAPENAGPLNSHLLVLRALERMRGVSPDYLGRFMSYADALLWLEQVDAGEAGRR